MKWTLSERALRPSLPFVTAVAAAVLTLLAVAGCHHRSVEDSLAAGDQAMQANKLGDAETAYQDAASNAPNDARPLVALGNLYAFEQKPAQAQTELLKAIALDKDNASAHAALGAVFESQAQGGSAEEQYRAAVALASGNAAYRISLGNLLQRHGRIGDAEAQLRTAVGLDPRNAHAHLALAKLLSEEPDRGAEAQSEFAQVQALDPSLMPSAPPPAAAAAAPPETAPSETAPAAAVLASPSASPAAESASMPAAATAPVRPVNRKFLLTHDSPVYEAPQDSSTVVAQVHRRKFVRVTGITGNWFRIQMKNGTVGFIPVSAAE
jgi:tetratricopeptide (TPR) repeat protein